jgi:hypothetical protein
MSAIDLLPKAVDKGVAFVPGAAFFAGQADARSLRLSFVTASVEQMSHDVVTFLHWAANLELVQRKQIGVRVVLFLLLMTGLTYAVKRKVWADVH